MAVDTLSNFDKVPENDITVRQKKERADAVDPHDTYKREKVAIEYGGKMANVEIRYTMDGTFAFATYEDNKDWQRVSYDIWRGVASEALEKFTAMRGAQVMTPTHPEITNRYNFMLETRGRLK